MNNVRSVNLHIPNVLEVVRQCSAGRNTCQRVSKYDPTGMANYDPTPAFPDTTLAVWLKPHELGLADGALVSTLPDSGNIGIDFVQSGGSRPTYKTAIKNGLDVLWFPSSILAIFMAQDGTITISDAIGDTSFVFFAVFNLLTAPPSGQTPPMFESGGSEAWFQGFNDTPHAVSIHNDSGGPDQADSAISTATWYVWESRHESGTLTLTLNGSDVDSVASGNFVSSGDNQLILGGGGASSDSAIFYLAEILLYNASLSSAQRTVVRDYLNDKWDVY